MTASERAKKAMARAGLILGIGLAYAFFCAKTGLALPCPFRAVTGLYCPGCGVTRMCMALLRLDFAGAWSANPVLLCLLPVLALVLGTLLWRWVRTGSARPARWQSALIWGMAAVLLVFGVLRNLGG